MARDLEDGHGGDADEYAAVNGPPAKALGEGEQSAITMRLFKMQMTALQSGLFFCLPALIEVAMTYFRRTIVQEISWNRGVANKDKSRGRGRTWVNFWDQSHFS